MGSYNPDAFSKICYWLAFSVLFALLPFWLDSLVKNPEAMNTPFWTAISNFFRKRELYIVCTVLLADAFSSLMQVRDIEVPYDRRFFVNPLRAACFIFAVITTGLYVATPRSAFFTATICFITLIVGGSSKAVS